MTSERIQTINSNYYYESLFDGAYATFNNISVISWRSVLLVEETEGLVENRDLSQVIDKLSHNVVRLALIEIGTHNISGDRHRLHR